MIPKSVKLENANDAKLVLASLSGNREAFAELVSRYQSLICSLAYSATGSLSQSEDLAQETFVTAWRELKHLREPQKLRSWLCGIARNIIASSTRRQQREPAGDAEALDSCPELPTSELRPSDLMIQREEEAILWRSLERIPENYREPLVLFYREHQSIEQVARALELSEDTVKQRLCRGRKMLHQEVLSFVEGALERTSPGKAFTIGVLAALPGFTLSTQAATLGVAAAKGSVTGKAAGAVGLGSVILTPLLALLGNWVGYRMSLDSARSDRERNDIRTFYGRLAGSILVFFVAYALLLFFARPLNALHSWLVPGLIVGMTLAYTIATAALLVWSWRARKSYADHAESEPLSDAAKPSWEYRSEVNLLGCPLIHIRLGGSLAVQGKPVRAWIAVGDVAFGRLFAFGGLAIAPVSIGGCAVGLLPFGGCSLGMLALGGFSIGLWSFGGLALGWEAFGGCAIAWKAAVGGAAIAHDFALGGLANAAQANNEAASHFIRSNLFFSQAQIVLKYLHWLNLLWVVPMLLWWRAVSGSKARKWGVVPEEGIEPPTKGL